MSEIWKQWRVVLAYMVIFPWPQKAMPKFVVGYPYIRRLHFLNWIYGWFISIVGIVGLGFYAPYIAEHIFIARWSFLVKYENLLVISIAFLGGIASQVVSVFMAGLTLFARRFKISSKSLLENNRVIIVLLMIFLICRLMMPLVTLLLPPIIAGFSVYWYIAHFAPSHNLTGTGIVGATVLKIIVAFIPGIIQSLVTGTLFAWLLRKLRGDDKPSSDN